MILSTLWGLSQRPWSRLTPLFFVFVVTLIGACSITAVRPAQEMSNMEISLRAAKEVNADVLAPELYRSATEVSLRAHREYKFKNFEAARKYADQARKFAERAEFEALRNGAKREAVPTDPLSEPSYAPEPIGTPSGAASPAAPGAATLPKTP